MHEYVANLHMHTRYSDGHGSHEEIARAAIQAGLDLLIVTDHNVLVPKHEGYHREGGRQVLMLVGEEVHDQARQPQQNHLLVMGASQEVATLAADPQRLIDGVNKAGGLSFLAHPFESPAPVIGEGEISWVDWEVQHYTGLELWNAMSELKSRLKSRLHGLLLILDPRRLACGPPQQTLEKWDELLMDGRKVVAVGGSDAHAFPVRLGPLRLTVFRYRFHFKTVNTHLLTPVPFNGELEHDRHLALEALRRGHAFIGYDLPAPTRGFRFTGQGRDGLVSMGDEISAREGVTLQIRLPRRAECRLLREGQLIKTWRQRETCTYITNDPGAYRVEVYLRYLGRTRGWIFSNPIYVRG
jgi:hypothetical protein